MYQNKVSLIGFLGGDAEVRNANNRGFTTLSLATKSSYKDKKSGQYVAQTEWHRCVVFGKLAEFAGTLSQPHCRQLPAPTAQGRCSRRVDCTGVVKRPQRLDLSHLAAGRARSLAASAQPLDRYARFAPAERAKTWTTSGLVCARRAGKSSATSTCYGIFSTYVDMVHSGRERGSLYVNEHPDSGIFSPLLVNRRTGEWRPISSFFNVERFLKDVDAIIDAARGPILSKAQMTLAVMRNFDAERAPLGLTMRDLLAVFRQCMFRSTSQTMEWSRKIYDRQNWTVMFINAEWFQDLFLYELPNLEMATSVVADPGLDPNRTVNSEVAFSFKNAGGWRQIEEHARRASSLPTWHQEHGRHRIFANGQFVPIEQLGRGEFRKVRLCSAPEAPTHAPQEAATVSH
jgi:Single-strand binding protein family